MPATPSILQQPAQGPCVARVVFPPPAEAPDLRNVASSALMRLADGSVRFLRLGRTSWTEARLDHAEARLLYAEHGRPAPHVLKALARELGDTSLALLNFAFDAFDPAAWDVRPAAAAFVAHAVARDPAGWTPARARAQAEAVEHRWRAQLAAAFADFARSLDEDACEAARAFGRCDTDVYNFLVRTRHREWRRQFVRAFPILVPTAIASPHAALGAFLREAVDEGWPLVKPLAARWSVSASAIRALIGQSCDHVGSRWQRTPHHLVRILDALCPEDRPRDAVAWQRFNEVVATAEALFRRPAEACPLTLGTIRRAARRGFAAAARPAITPEAIAVIDRFRLALAGSLAVEACPEAPGPGPDLARERAQAVADRCLASLPVARLVSIARRFAAEYGERHAVAEEALRACGGMRFWPVLPGPLASTDGRHVVVALGTLNALRDEGVAQSLCIDEGIELVRLAEDCAAGDAFVVSIRDSSTGQRQSTAELRPMQHYGLRMPRLRIHQHKARGNGRPSPGCVEALHEALAWANGEAGAKHRQEGRRHAQAAVQAPSPRIASDREATREALSLALGGGALDRLAADVRALAHVRQEAS